jgi:hypothetical protein
MKKTKKMISLIAASCDILKLLQYFLLPLFYVMHHYRLPYVRHLSFCCCWWWWKVITTNDQRTLKEKVKSYRYKHCIAAIETREEASISALIDSSMNDSHLG